MYDSVNTANGEWLALQDRSDGVMSTSLFMRQASEVSFRTYTLHAENSVAVTTAKVTLIRSMRCEVMPASRRKQSTQFSPDKTVVVMHY